MKRLSQRGFALFEMIAIVGVLAIVTLAGWNIYQRSHKNGAVSSSFAAPAIKVVPPAPTVTTANDLNKASQTLDQTSLDSNSDTAQLDQDLASF